KLMNQHGLLSLIRRKKYRSYRADGGRASDNLLARNFTSEISGVTNGAIVIHTQRLKSDPGGNLLS
ncbi:hypothetical protein, partial [Yersinia pestis]|uniref:hypothetical protein n=1 Tax=Yersinia pestis TaxID=632 RepID=UPI001122E484